MKAKIRQTLLLIPIVTLLFISIVPIAMADAPLYTKLFYSTINLQEGPRFTCQNCNWSFTRQSDFDLLKSSLISDINLLVTFRCPNCQSQYDLYVALHRYPDGSIAICIQKSGDEGVGGIDAEWWVNGP